MVFWEGLIPSPDVIDAGHRNGVPVLGTIFYNWSSSIEDQEKFVASMRQDPDGSFPVARKLVDMAKYYGFDGYFINQETTGSMVQPLGETMRNFMLYTKEYAESIGYPITYSWYDAMTYEYGRYHEDGLGEYNYPFMEKEGDKVPAIVSLRILTGHGRKITIQSKWRNESVEIHLIFLLGLNCNGEALTKRKLTGMLCLMKMGN